MNIQHTKNQKLDSGFTILEVLVVVAVIAILLTISFASINKNKQKTRDNIRISDIRVIRLALDQYRNACGLYPASLDIDENNGRNGTCQGGVTLEDFLPQIPENPSYKDGFALDGDHNRPYLYTGHSNVSNGPCYEYHIGVQLEYEADVNFNGASDGHWLEDHDYSPGAGSDPYEYRCDGSAATFDGDDDEGLGIYDFRSQNPE